MCCEVNANSLSNSLRYRCVEMEGNLPTGSMMQAGSFGMLDLQNPIHNRHQQQPHPSFHLHQHQNLNNPQLSLVQPTMHDMCDQRTARGKPSTSEDDEPSFNTEESGKGKKASPWQRMKWTDQIVRLLITAVSYLGEDAAADCSGSRGRKKIAILQKKGKWKSISKVLAERGCYVSPQQCEDKFNDLNKRYKRLTDILGRGTSCKVVENPALLDMMDHISDKAKDDVRKILSSKHLFYEEMCSYHNGNRLHLPADPALHRSLQLALRSGDEHDKKRAVQEDLDEDEIDSDDMEDDADDNIAPHGDTGRMCSHKRTKQGLDHHEEAGFGSPLGSQGCNVTQAQAQGISVDMNQVFPQGSQADLAQKQFMMSRKLQLEEQSLQIQAQMLDLKRQRFKWQRFSKKKDRELDKMKTENKRMKLENERLQLELKHKELDLDLN